jgi:predicted dehydrogenase
MQTGKWGKLRSVVGIYNKGILNNGSHLLNLLQFLVGSLEIIQVGKPVFDFFPEDPTVPFLLEGANDVPVNIVCGHAEDYSIFELQLFFSKGVLSMEGGGLFWRERWTESSQVFKGYRTVDGGTQKNGGYSLAMVGALDNIYQVIKSGHILYSTGESALNIQSICERIKKDSLAM